MTPSAEVRTARAVDRPCELHTYHSPRVTRTQRHHRKPVFLQNRAYGRIVDNDDVKWLCGTCHDSVGEWIDHLLGESRKPDPEPGRLAKTEAQYSYDWFTTAMKEKA